jgi:hypothetical protein
MDLLDTPVSTATQMPHSKLTINVPGVMIRKAIHEFAATYKSCGVNLFFRSVLLQLSSPCQDTDIEGG